MAGAVWVIQSHIPAQIGSQTSSISGDVAVLKEQFGTIKADVSEIRKDIKDILIKALDATRQDAHEAIVGANRERIDIQARPDGKCENDQQRRDSNREAARQCSIAYRWSRLIRCAGNRNTD